MLNRCLSAALGGLLLAASLAGCDSKPRTEQATPPQEETIGGLFPVHHPAWAAHASLYQVNVRQYTPAGTFNAFRTHLPRLQQMGVGILWLMPIHPIGQEKRKGTLGSAYSVRDFRAVNPDLGTLADLKALVQDAHQRGMHVILDWVPNHSAWDNPLVKQHPDWYTRDSAGRMQPPVADWQDVVDFNYDNPAMRQYMTESMKYWVKAADVDGFRCDVAGLVPTDFWDHTRQELEALKPVFMLAEWDELHHPPFVKTFDPNTRLLEHAFDATYALKLHYLVDSIGKGLRPVAAIDDYLKVERAKYPPNVYLMNFTSSHDVNTWDGTEYDRLGINAFPLAALVTMLPGIPLVYSGQELPLKKRLRFFDKDTIPFGTMYLLLPFYQKLLKLKQRHAALANGDPASQFVRLSSPDSVYAFVRRKGDAAVLVAVNLGARPHTVEIPAAQTGRWRGVLAHMQPTLSPQAPLPVPAHTALVLEQVL